jgi:nucleoside-diphosphate-sugar epimerase
MKVLVTSGAGFVGSHTCDRLLTLGHEAVVLDVRIPPVHRTGRPGTISPGADLYTGDVRNRDLLTNLLRQVDAGYHSAYQDYLPYFSRFSDAVMLQYGSAEAAVATGEYRFGDRRHILLDISAPRGLGRQPCRTPADSVAAYATLLKGMDGLDGILAEANARIRALGAIRRVER